MTQPRLAIVLSGFPRRSETFALGEVSALEQRGLVAALFSTKPGEDGPSQPGADRLLARMHMLSGDADSQADEAARHLEGIDVAGVHAYFAHAPSTIGQALACRLGVPFGFSVHARDARKISRAQLHQRARQAACVVACNEDVAREFDGRCARVQVVPHGVDLGRFIPAQRASRPVFQMLAVGRLVEKKGFDVLLDALSLMTIPWTLRVVGDGPLREALSAQAVALAIAGRVSFCGSMTHEALPAEYAGADAVVVPSLVDRSGDRDGLPNVVLEAMACGVPVVAADVGAITTAIRPGENGLIVAAGDRAALAAALTALAHDAGLRASLGAAARAIVERDYDVSACTDRLAAVLREAYA